jgi:hypothetical protein
VACSMLVLWFGLRCGLWRSRSVGSRVVQRIHGGCLRAGRGRGPVRKVRMWWMVDRRRLRPGKMVSCRLREDGLFLCWIEGGVMLSWTYENVHINFVSETWLLWYGLVQ